MTTDQTTAPESAAQDALASSGQWKFMAVADAQEVTKTLNYNKAKRANVAFAGQEQAGKQYGVWYLPSSHSKHWKLAVVDFDPNSDNDTKAITHILKNSDESTVTFVGQLKKYFVWWLKS